MNETETVLISASFFSFPYYPIFTYISFFI